MGYGEGLTKLLWTILACCEAAIVPIPDLWLEQALDERPRDTDLFNQLLQVIRGHLECAGGPSAGILET